MANARPIESNQEHFQLRRSVGATSSSSSPSLLELQERALYYEALVARTQETTGIHRDVSLREHLRGDLGRPTTTH